jgi:hypothetical protein
VETPPLDDARRMITKYDGLGKVRLHHGHDLTTGIMSVATFAYDDPARHGVRLVTTDPLPGGCSVEIILSSASAERLARDLHSLAQAAKLKEDESSRDPEKQAPLLMMTA